jgi:hypothetical protein
MSLDEVYGESSCCYYLFPRKVDFAWIGVRFRASHLQQPYCFRIVAIGDKFFVSEAVEPID